MRTWPTDFKKAAEKHEEPRRASWLHGRAPSGRPRGMKQKKYPSWKVILKTLHPPPRLSLSYLRLRNQKDLEDAMRKGGQSGNRGGSESVDGSSFLSYTVQRRSDLQPGSGITTGSIGTTQSDNWERNRNNFSLLAVNFGVKGA